MRAPRMIFRGLIVTATLLASNVALAHGGEKHVMGTVVAVDGKHVEVKGKDGKTISVALDDNTTFHKGKAAAKVTDIVVGERVVVHAGGEGAALTAHEVMLGKSPAKK